MSADAWPKLLEFLTAVGVDVKQALDADIHISAGVEEGAVAVTQFVKNQDGGFRMREGEFLRETKTYTFSRPLERVEPRLVQEEVPDV